MNYHKSIIVILIIFLSTSCKKKENNWTLQISKFKNSYIYAQKYILENSITSCSNLNQKIDILSTKTLQNIYEINNLIDQKNLPKVDITTSTPNNSVTSDNFKLSNQAVETLESKIIEYLINNQTIDKALETQKLY